jgi:hypothetical protein
VVSTFGATTVFTAGSTSAPMLSIRFAGKRWTVWPTLSGATP